MEEKMTNMDGENDSWDQYKGCIFGSTMCTKLMTCITTLIMSCKSQTRISWRCQHDITFLDIKSRYHCEIILKSLPDMNTNNAPGGTLLI